MTELHEADDFSVGVLIDDLERVDERLYELTLAATRHPLLDLKRTIELSSQRLTKRRREILIALKEAIEEELTREDRGK